MNKYIYNLGQAFESVAKATPNKKALLFIDKSFCTYKELNERANSFAFFMNSCGLKKGDVVTIFNDKSLSPFSIMIACLKSGITYSNLDINSPRERLKKMVEICHPALFFTPTAHASLLHEIGIPDEKIKKYDHYELVNALATSTQEIEVDCSEIDGSTPAYLMFTSGSTGFPKGVVISHFNVLNFIGWSKQTYRANSDDIFTNVNPMHFDNSVFDFYASLFSGAGLIPIPEDLTKHPRKLILTLNELNPTIWFSVPSMLVYVLKLRALNAVDLQSLRIITFGGEGFPKGQLRKLWKILGSRVEFINVYGPTECTCICSSYKVSAADMESDELLPLGPIAENFNHIIIDNNEEIIPDESIGELCIAGPNVGIGYYNNPDQTKASFIQNPNHNLYPDIVYKSGDLVKYNNDKNLLYFCGRKDNQIKRMGYRIELEEIENVLGALNYIEECAVIFDKKTDETGKIIACLRSPGITEQHIVNDIREALPSYMKPDYYVFYEHLPKNQNGKINRLKLKREFIDKLKSN